MSSEDGLLSQSDLDALTAGLGLGAASSSKPQASEVMRKFLKILAEQSSGVVSTVLSRAVEFQLSQVIDAAEFDALDVSLGESPLKISVNFSREIRGTLVLVIGRQAASILADLMLMGGGNADYSEEHKDAIQEMINQIMGAFSTTLTSEVGLSVELSPQAVENADLGGESEKYSVRGDIVLHIEGFPDHRAYWFMDNALAQSLLSSKMNESGREPLETNLSSLGISTAGTVSQSPSPAGAVESGGAPRASGAFSSTGNKALDLLMDIELPLTIELGRTRMSLKRVLELGPGAIVEMERFAGEPVDILINGKVVAKGEVVVVDENFGVRLVGLVSPEERIRMLR